MKDILKQFVDNVPEYKEFLTVAEMDQSSRDLAAKYPERVKLFEIGKSRAGHPLLCLKIGDESVNPDVGLMFGCPHPNEPIGTMLLEHFSWSVAADEALLNEIGYTWYIVKSWDCDGTILNENWFKGPYTITNYARNFFRPAGHQQVDWTFPVDYKELHFNKPIPETQAMMKLIADIKPKFIYSLHNAGFGGVYWYITKPMPEIYEKMHEAANRQAVPLNLGEPEMPYCISYYPAIYAKTSVKDNYDYKEKNGVTDIGGKIETGTCSADYAEELCGAFTLLTELPYFFDSRISNMEKSSKTRREVVLEKLDYDDSSDGEVREVMDSVSGLVDDNNPFKTALKAFTKPSANDATRKMALENPDYANNATVAEEVSNLLIAKFYQLLTIGMLVRMPEYELEQMAKRGETNPDKEHKLEQAKKEALVLFDELAGYLEKEINYQVVPIKKLVSIQLEAGLLTMDYLKTH